MTEPEEHLISLIDKHVLAKSDKWGSGRFRLIKTLSTSHKGDIAEEFAVWLAKWHGFDAEKHKSKRGQWDVRIAGVTLEVKVATEDIGGSFQFNGVRYDTKYDRLLVVGISPDRALFNIYPRRDLMDMPLVRMAKGTNSAFKLTRKAEQLRDLSEFPGFFEKSK
ncbi:MAG: hypothetical protein MPJ81_02130 [Gammaproteobacteria bacterium]|nr:hypothetical protein [Gammaproteobacteria bacterium]